MPRPLLALALLLPLAGCMWEGRPDGGSPTHTDNGALAAHRDAVESAARPEVVEALDAAPSEAPVPTPRLGTVASGEAAEANSGALATPPSPVPGGGTTPAGTTPASN